MVISISNALAAKNKPTIQPEDIDSITVLAPTSLVVPITELCRIYSRKTKQDVNAVFDSSSENAINIEDGDPADIVIVESKKWFDSTDKKGLVDSSTKSILAKNELVVVKSRWLDFSTNNKQNLVTILDGLYNKTLPVIADSNADALGEYTIQALFRVNLWEKYQNRVVLAASSFQTADLIIKGQSAGVVYASDAKLYSSELDELIKIPAKFYKPIEYLAAVVIGEDMEKSRDFLKFLASKEAKIIFKKHGFVVD